MNTPWGDSQLLEPVCEGIINVSTVGHGGLRVLLDKASKMPVPLRNLGTKDFRCWWFEQDCAFAAVCCSFPESFDPEDVSVAEKILKDWYPDAWMAWKGAALDPSESHILRDRAFAEEHINDWLVQAAGKPKGDAPPGMVACVATRLGKEKGFLVPEDEYRTRGDFPFVIDETKHASWG